jgi:signal transduction histidine kinase
LDKALSLAQEIKDHELEVSAFQLFGQLYRKQGRYSEALQHYQKAAKICEQINNTQELSGVFKGIGGTYQLMKNYDQALVYYEKAEQIALRHDYKQILTDIYISLADIYARINSNKEKGLSYGKKALSISRQLENTFSEIEALQSIVTIYYFFDDYQNALLYVDSAIRKTEPLDAPDLSAYSSIMASNIHYDLQQYEQCVEKAWKALEADSTNANLKLNVYSNLSLAHAYLGNPDLTREYMAYYTETKNNYSNEIYQNSLSEMEVKYETEKKELKIETLEKQRQLYIWLGIAGALILLIALAFAFIRYRLAVSRRKLAEEESQRLAQEKQLVAVQATLDGEAAERSRLAKDLHDGLGSMLSVVKFNLPNVQGGAVLEAVDVTRFQKALGMLDESIQELRRVAHHMMPESLLRYGLKTSLSDFCDAIPMVDFHYFGEEKRLPEKLEILIYRCIHELVNNALKHAQATHINVQLVQETDRISFTVQDDGIGFDLKTASEGMGLHNLRQRVAAFQGKVSIYSSDNGTEINVELKLKNDNSHDKSSHS